MYPDAQTISDFNVLKTCVEAFFQTRFSLSQFCCEKKMRPATAACVEKHTCLISQRKFSFLFMCIVRHKCVSSTTFSTWTWVPCGGTCFLFERFWGKGHASDMLLYAKLHRRPLHAVFCSGELNSLINACCWYLEWMVRPTLRSNSPFLAKAETTCQTERHIGVETFHRVQCKLLLFRN